MTNWWHDSEALSEGDRALIERSVERDLANGVPGPDAAQARRVANAELIDLFGASAVRHSMLGPEWSSDLDVHLDALPNRAALLERDWLPLDDLLARLGRSTKGRWAIRRDGRVVGAADLTTEARPDVTSGVIDRASQPNVRSVLELRALQRDGTELPDTWGVRACAQLERRLGGDELPVREARPTDAAEKRARATKATVGRVRRGPGMRLAVSGVDGAGKSTLLDTFVRELELASIPYGKLWARPGYDLGALDAAAVGVKRLLGKQPEPGVRAMGADDTAAPPSRSGKAAVAWRQVVLGEYLAKVRRREAMIDGLVVFDRYDIDAEATLGFAYGLDASWLGPLLRRSLARPDVHVWLEIEAAVAAARKPDDPMGQQAIADQIERYGKLLPDYPGIDRCDATRPTEDLVADVWAKLLAAAS